MKVAFATTWNSKCGVAVYSRSLIAEMEKKAGIDVVSLDRDMTQTPIRLAARLNEGDIIHIQHQYPFFGGMAFHRNRFRQVLKRLKKPLVVTVHELDLGDRDTLPIRMYKQWFNRHLFGTQIDRIIVHTQEYQGRLQELGIDPSVIRVVPEGVPAVSPPSISSMDAKHTLGLAGKRIITIFGFVVRRKGYEIALDAINRLPDDVVLLIAGGQHPDDHTGFIDELNEQISADNLSGRVLVTGYLPENRVPLVMAATDVIAAPFTYMSNSSSIMRSIAYGKPIAASDLPATREINERLPCLTLFEVSNPKDLADKVLDLLEDERKMADAVTAVRAYADTFTIGKSAAETIAVYEEICE